MIQNMWRQDEEVQEPKPLTRVAVVAAGIAAASALHYFTAPSLILWHNLFQRLYYLPIIYAAIYFGWRGGLVASTASAVCYIPHILMAWHHMLDYLRKTKSVRDVVVSGGDMANVPIKRLEDFVMKLLDIENIRDIRLATKGLMGIPQHFLQDEVKAAAERMANKANARGADIAIEHDCFSCHGPLGAGGVPNPGAFKGYIPGFWGADFDELVQNAKGVPLSQDQVRVDREEIWEILDQMRATIPEEIKQARWIVKERQEMLAEAKREAERILKEARERQTQLTSEQEVTKQAERAAEDIIEDARAREREIRLGAEDYADEILNTLEVNLSKFIAAVQRGRERLQGKDEPAEVA
jgi:mono/diheme cytochrome c family protein